MGPSSKDAASFISHRAPPCPRWDDKRWSLRSEKEGGSSATVPSKGEDATSLDDSSGMLICECCLPLLGEITGCSGGCVCCDVALSDLTSVAEEVSWPTDLLAPMCQCVSHVVSFFLSFFLFEALLNFGILSGRALVFCFSVGHFLFEFLKNHSIKQTKNSDCNYDGITLIIKQIKTFTTNLSNQCSSNATQFGRNTDVFYFVVFSMKNT